MAEKEKAHHFFRTHKAVECPAFPGENVYFNSKGLSHLFYKGSSKTASRVGQESLVRISLLPHALKILEKMPFPQEESMLVDIKGRVCRYFAFEAVIDNRRVKVIVRQVGNGRKHFWSVIPAWRKIRGLTVNAKSSLHKQKKSSFAV